MTDSSPPLMLLGCRRTDFEQRCAQLGIDFTPLEPGWVDGFVCEECGCPVHMGRRQHEQYLQDTALYKVVCLECAALIGNQLGLQGGSFSIQHLGGK